MRVGSMPNVATCAGWRNHSTNPWRSSTAAGYALAEAGGGSAKAAMSTLEAVDTAVPRVEVAAVHEHDDGTPGAAAWREIRLIGARRRLARVPRHHARAANRGRIRRRQPHTFRWRRRRTRGCRRHRHRRETER